MGRGVTPGGQRRRTLSVVSAPSSRPQTRMKWLTPHRSTRRAEPTRLSAGRRKGAAMWCEIEWNRVGSVCGHCFTGGGYGPTRGPCAKRRLHAIPQRERQGASSTDGPRDPRERRHGRPRRGGDSPPGRRRLPCRTGGPGLRAGARRPAGARERARDRAHVRSPRASRRWSSAGATPTSAPAPTSCRTCDLETGDRRPSTLEDVARAARIVDALPNMDFAMSSAYPSEVDPHHAYVLSFVDHDAQHGEADRRHRRERSRSSRDPRPRRRPARRPGAAATEALLRGLRGAVQSRWSTPSTASRRCSCALVPASPASMSRRR